MNEQVPLSRAKSFLRFAWLRYGKIGLWLALVTVTLLWDRPLYEIYHRWLGQSVALDAIAQFLTQAITLPWIGAAAVGLSLCEARLRWRFLLDVAFIMPTQALWGDFLKRLFGRLRPEEAAHLTIFTGPHFSRSDFGFPSGHAIAAFAFAAILSHWYPRARPAFLVLAICVCLARVQLERHFFSDVLFGAGIGWLWAQALLSLRQYFTVPKRLPSSQTESD